MRKINLFRTFAFDAAVSLRAFFAKQSDLKGRPERSEGSFVSLRTTLRVGLLRAKSALATTLNAKGLLFLSSLLVSGSLFCAGCLDSPVPPFTDQDIITDDKMIGQWIPVSPKTDEAPPIYTVIPSGDKLYQLHIKEDGKDSLAQMTLFKLGELLYLSLKYPQDEVYDTVQYIWEKDDLRVTGFDKKRFTALSKKEKLDLEFKMDETSAGDSLIFLNATTEKIRNFIERYGSEVFSGEPIIFKRINE